MPDLTMSDLQVIWVLGDHIRGIQPGSFYQALIEAALKADEFNLRKIGLGFPEIARSIETWRGSPDGWGVLAPMARPLTDPEQARVNAWQARHAERVRLALAVCEGVADDRLNARALARLMQMIFEDPSQPIKNGSHLIMIRPRTQGPTEDDRLPGADDTLDDEGPDPEMS